MGHPKASHFPEWAGLHGKQLRLWSKNAGIKIECYSRNFESEFKNI